MPQIKQFANLEHCKTFCDEASKTISPLWVSANIYHYTVMTGRIVKKLDQDCFILL